MAFKDLEEFAEGQQTRSTILRHTELAKDVLKYYEPARVLNKIVTEKQISRTSTIIPKDVENFTEMAVRVGENLIAPIYRTKRTAIPVILNKLQTRYEVTDDAEIEDELGDAWEHEAEEAGLRMARREDYDIANVLAGFTYSTAATVTGKLSPYDVSLAKTVLENRGHYADTLLMNPTQFADIEAEVNVQSMEYTSEEAKVKGYVYAEYMGLKIIKSAKVTAGVVYVIDLSSKPIKMVRYAGSKTETYRKTGVADGALITTWYLPYLFRPKAGQKITSC